MNISKGLVISLGLIVTLIILNAVLAFRNTRAVHEQAAQVRHADDVLGYLEALISMVKDAETGQRGFIIVGEKPYLDPYNDALAAIPDQLGHIKQLAGGSAGQQARIAELEEKIDHKLAELAKTVALRKPDREVDGKSVSKSPEEVARDTATATDMIKSGRGRKLMVEIREKADQIEQEEQRLLVEREKKANESYQWAVTSGSLGAALSLMLVAGVFYVMYRHVSARIEAAAVIYEERERFRTTLASIGDAVIVTDVRGRVTFINTVAEYLTGWPHAAALGQPLTTVFNIINEETRQPVENPVEKVLRSGMIEGLANHTVLIAKDGREFPIDDSGAPVRDADHKIRGVVLVFRDFTERKKTEETLVEAKVVAEAANVAKSRFLANMSHELRTPMNAILGMIDVALPKANDPTVADCLQTAKGSADLLLTLLNDLLDSAKIESGKLELESAPFSLRRMMDQISRVLSMRASEKGLCFCCRMPEETPDVVRGDRVRLQQILLNLATNAIKFTEKGDVEMSLTAATREGKTALTFAVRDTGIGISDEAQERLFQPFAQADATMARRFGGTGLGLAICKSLVEMMGGQIFVESELNQGSTFRFTVRLQVTDEAPLDFDAPSDFAAAAHAQLRILLVEDNPANQKLATYILQDRGHVVEAAIDGHEAYRLSGENHYDVILMDVQMPKMNGLETTAAIRKREAEGRRAPIIAMTAHAMKGDRDHCLAAGMDGYLSKPVNAQELIVLVESIASHSTPLCDPQSSQSPQPAAATRIVFDADEALTRCADSRDVLQQMIQYFFDDVRSLLPQVRASLEKGDLAEVGRLAHRMNGTFVYLGAEAAILSARSLEMLCDSPGVAPADVAEAVIALEVQCDALKQALLEFQATAESQVQ